MQLSVLLIRPASLCKLNNMMFFYVLALSLVDIFGQFLEGLIKLLEVLKQIRTMHGACTYILPFNL